MMADELKVTADFEEKFAPVPVSELRVSESGYWQVTGREVPGRLLKAADRAFALGLP